METARLFLGWRPDLHAVRGDQRQERHHRHLARGPRPGDPRPRPLGVRPRRPEVLGGEPRHLRGRGVRRPRLPAPAARRRPQPRRRQRVGAASRVTPLTQAPGAALRRALTVLDEGEEWLLEPRVGAGQPAALVARHQARRAAAARSSTARSASAPCWASCAPRISTQAIALANATPFGLTSGIQSLDDREIARWVDRVEAGNLYVNRPITGAIVRRQPFGGWKASSVGPGAKAGGPNYVLQLARWRQAALPLTDREPLPERLAALLERCLAALSGERGPRGRAGQRRELRARVATALRPGARPECDPRRAERAPLSPVPTRGRAGRERADLAVVQVALAACAVGVPLTVSLPRRATRALARRRRRRSTSWSSPRPGSWSASRIPAIPSACASGRRCRRPTARPPSASASLSSRRRSSPTDASSSAGMSGSRPSLRSFTATAT